jgi:membrane protein DedA with SNARE-associated domain
LLQTLVDWLTRVVGDHGAPAVFGLMILESACIPVPSEVIMLFAGLLIHQGQMSFLAAVIAGVAGNVVGSWIAWGVGAYGGRCWIERHGRVIHVTPERLEQADRWFQRYGTRAVLISRCLPIIRTFISLPAGIARMPFWQFTLYTLIGCIPWVIALALLGVWAGSAWETWHSRLEILDYVVGAAIVVGVVYLFVRSRRRQAA